MLAYSTLFFLFFPNLNMSESFLIDCFLECIRNILSLVPVHLTPPTKTELDLSGGGLKDNYKLIDVHFHWGAGRTLGSEHTLNDVP